MAHSCTAPEGLLRTKRGDVSISFGLERLTGGDTRFPPSPDTRPPPARQAPRAAACRADAQIDTGLPVISGRAGVSALAEPSHGRSKETRLPAPAWVGLARSAEGVSSRKRRREVAFALCPSAGLARPPSAPVLEATPSAALAPRHSGADRGLYCSLTLIFTAARPAPRSCFLPVFVRLRLPREISLRALSTEPWGSEACGVCFCTWTPSQGAPAPDVF